MTMSTPDAAPIRPRWMYPALIASLALNLLFVGGMGAAAWHHRHGGGKFGRDGGLTGFVRDLPADRQTAVRTSIDAGREAIRPLRNAVKAAFAESSTALTEEPFDPVKFKASMDRLAEAESRLKAAMSSALGDTASKLSVDERRKLQGWREKVRPGFGHRRHEDRDNGPDAKDKSD